MHALALVPPHPVSPETGASDVHELDQRFTAVTSLMDTGSALRAQVLQHLTERGFVPFHARLAERYGHRAALFLSVCLYWTRRNTLASPATKGWFYLTARQIQDATTLTRHEQDTVRAQLRAAGILDECKGKNGVLWFRLNLRKLAAVLEVIHVPPDAQLDAQQAWGWFRNAIAFYRPLADLAGSAAGGLLLSWLLRQQRQAIRQGLTLPLLPALHKLPIMRLAFLGRRTRPFQTASD